MRSSKKLMCLVIRLRKRHLRTMNRCIKNMLVAVSFQLFVCLISLLTQRNYWSAFPTGAGSLHHQYCRTRGYMQCNFNRNTEVSTWAKTCATQVPCKPWFKGSGQNASITLCDSAQQARITHKSWPSAAPCAKLFQICTNMRHEYLACSLADEQASDRTLYPPVFITPGTNPSLHTTSKALYGEIYSQANTTPKPSTRYCQWIAHVGPKNA